MRCFAPTRWLGSWRTFLPDPGGPGRPGVSSAVPARSWAADRCLPPKIAVDAKISHPFDKPVGECRWNAEECSRTRLTAICELPRCCPPPVDMCDQLFYLTAGAILEARLFGINIGAMVAQSFAQGHLWFEPFGALCGFLCPVAANGRRLMNELPRVGNSIPGWATHETRLPELVTS